MTAPVIDFLAARDRRLGQERTVIRIGHNVRRKGTLAVGHVIDLIGDGSPETPVVALVQFAYVRTLVPAARLERCEP